MGVFARHHQTTAQADFAWIDALDFGCGRGDKTLSEVERYTASADQERMAREA